MKTLSKKHIVRTLIVLLILLGTASSLFAVQANTHRQKVLLAAYQKEVFTRGYGGHHGRSKVQNHVGSAGVVACSLQGSLGSSWRVWDFVYAQPGKTATTKTWGRHDVDYLLRTRVYVPVETSGNPGRVAEGHIYTD